MAAADARKIRQVCREKLLAVAGVTVDLVALENRGGFHAPEPKAGKFWIREHLRVSSEVHAAWDEVESIWRMQYDVVVPRNFGTELGEEKAALIMDAFKPGTSINSQGILLSIDRHERLPYLQLDDVWVLFPVSVRLRTYEFL